MTEEIVKTGYAYDLKDIETKEVSLVDRAANKRKFLIIKNFGGIGMKTDLELGLDEMKADTIPPPVLAAVIKMTQSAIEKLISLAAKLEGLQGKSKADTDGTTEKAEKAAPLPAELSKEFKSIIAILDSILQKYPSATQKKEEPAVSPEKAKEADAAVTKIGELNETFNNLSKKLEDLKVIVEKFNKEKTEMSDEKNKEPEKEIKKEEPKGEQKVETPQPINKAEILSEMKKMLDDRATDLVKLFKEAASEEFKPLFDRVSAIETVLGGNKEKDKKDEVPPADYQRNFGMQEGDPKITDEANPFKSIFTLIS
jgi:hypothetical protein